MAIRAHTVALAAGLLVAAFEAHTTTTLGSPLPPGSASSSSTTITVKHSKLPDDRNRVALAATHHHLYVIGGRIRDRTATNYPHKTVPNVLVAALLPSGALGPWRETTALPMSRIGHAAVVVGRFLYVIGGCSNRCGALDIGDVDKVFRGRIGKNGLIERWDRDGSLPDGIHGHTAVTFNGFIYVIGGTPMVSRETIWKAEFDPDGSIATWKPERALPERRSQHHSLIVGNQLYVGYGHGGTNWLTDALVTKIAPDGSLAPWTNLGSSPSPMSVGALAELARLRSRGAQAQSLQMDTGFGLGSEATQIVVGDYVYQFYLGGRISVARLP